jgi:hypothetical protein
MEGGAQIVTAPFRRSVLPTSLLLLAILFTLKGTAHAGERYLIVENPGKLVIYDMYQRILGAKESSGLGLFVPIHIVSPKTLLGDGLTACMKVDIRGEPLYLLLDPDGRLAGESSAGRVVQLEGIPLNDTVNVLRSDHLLFEPAGTSLSRFLPSGERLIRVFQHGTRTYVWRQRVPPAFGWVVFNSGGRNRVWEVVTAPPAPGSVMTARIRDGVRSRINHVNTVLLGLYGYFNEAARVHHQPPRWTMDSDAGALTCVLQNTSRPEAFGESTRALAKELESVVLGSGLGVVSGPGKIVIRPK